MSVQGLEQFRELINSNEQIGGEAGRILRVSGSGFAGELARLGQSKGIDVSAEDFDSEAFHAMLDGELSPMELDLVGGGTGVDTGNGPAGYTLNGKV
jgi:hypothetical protein